MWRGSPKRHPICASPPGTPAITYEIDGVQYVAIAVGGLATQTASTNGDMVWAFSLRGSPRETGNRLRLELVREQEQPSRLFAIEEPPRCATTVSMKSSHGLQRWVTKLVTTSFPNSITRGFASVGEPHVAVCLLPGTEVAFEQEVEYDYFLPFFGKRKAGATVAQFRQINQWRSHPHRDALEFPNGKIVLLTELTEGQHATVLQLPVAARAPEKVAEQTDKLTINS